MRGGRKKGKSKKEAQPTKAKPEKKESAHVDTILGRGTAVQARLAPAKAPKENIFRDKNLSAFGDLKSAAKHVEGMKKTINAGHSYLKEYTGLVREHKKNFTEADVKRVVEKNVAIKQSMEEAHNEVDKSLGELDLFFKERKGLMLKADELNMTPEQREILGGEIRQLDSLVSKMERVKANSLNTANLFERQHEGLAVPERYMEALYKQFPKMKEAEAA